MCVGGGGRKRKRGDGEMMGMTMSRGLSGVSCLIDEAMKDEV